jgi:hypothetical protein
MRSTDRNADNLFLRLFSYTPREGRSALEDFCTESLAWCLRNSPDLRSKVFNLTGLPPLKQLDPLHPVEIDTQHSFESEDDTMDGDAARTAGRFDIIIRSTAFRFVLAVETKLWSTPKKEQCDLYLHDLETGEQFKSYPRSHRFLVSLTALSEKSPHVDAHLVWGKIQELLAKKDGVDRQSRAAVKDAAPVQLICRQFADFLKEKGLAPMNISKINQNTIASFVKAMSVREELEVILKSLPLSIPELRSKRPKYVYYEDQRAGCLCMMPSKPGILDTVGFAFKESEQGAGLSMHVSKMFPGDRREIISNFDERLKKCFTYKEDAYVPQLNESWFNFEQPVTPEYDGNGEKMREWFVQTCEAVKKLGPEPRKSGLQTAHRKAVRG